MLLKKIPVLLTLLLLIGCSGDDDSPAQSVPPVNLQAEITISPNKEGLVEVQATADNANFFQIEFFTSKDSEVIETNDGKASFQYTEEGTFKILVRAHASFDNFIEIEKNVTIDLNQGGGGGGNSGIPDTGYTTPLSYPNLTLVWNDEFNGTTLSSDWIHETGTGNNGWGNKELQYYRPENTEVRDGYLIITAKTELFGSSSYTSSRITTNGQQSFQYGRIDIRAALPQGQGLWPALWMLGDAFNTVGWPACGEIDIMEMVGGDHNSNQGDDYVHGTAHWEQNGSRAQFGDFNKLDNGIYADEFHVFSIIWDQNSIKWYRDDILYNELDITPSQLSEFHAKFFFIFNVAVGGEWPGSPDNTTQFPQQMAVDYVRVFQ